MRNPSARVSARARNRATIVFILFLCFPPDRDAANVTVSKPKLPTPAQFLRYRVTIKPRLAAIVGFQDGKPDGEMVAVGPRNTAPFQRGIRRPTKITPRRTGTSGRRPVITLSTKLPNYPMLDPLSD